MFLLRNKNDISIFRMKKKAPYLLLCRCTGWPGSWSYCRFCRALAHLFSFLHENVRFEYMYPHICNAEIVFKALHYENTPIQIFWKFHHQKWEVFRSKIWFFFHISAQNIDCEYSLEPPRRGGSNEYPQSMLLSRNKKNNVYPCKPQFYYIKVGFNGVKII